MQTIGIMANSGKEAALQIARMADVHLRERGVRC